MIGKSLKLNKKKKKEQHQKKTKSRKRAESEKKCSDRSGELKSFGVKSQTKIKRSNHFVDTKMGYELTRFQGDVDEELVCPICAGVLEEPLQAAVCEHAFCRACITEWLSRQPTCPVDRNAITTTNLRPVPRILKNLLAR